MSSQSSPAKPRLKSTKVTVGEIDMNSPFQSVINMVADTGPTSAECRSIRSVEKWASLKTTAELQLARDELAKTREELVRSEIVKGQAEQELVHMKRLVDELAIKLKEVVEMSEKERVRANDMEHASFTAAEDWKADLEAMQRQHEAEVRNLQGVRLAYEDLKLEFAAAIDAKEQAVRMAGEAMKEAEVVAKRAESLSAELAEAKVSLAETTKAYKIIDELLATKAVPNAACQNAAQEGAAIVAGKESELGKGIEVSLQVKNEVDQFTRELVAARQLEEYIHEMKIELESLKRQLATAKDTEYHHAQAAMDMNAKLERATSEIYQARVSESSAVSLLALVRAELGETQQKLSRVCADVATLTASSLSLTKELEHNRTLLLELQEKESNAQAEAASSMSKFIQTAEDLQAALVRETKSKETIHNLTTLLEDAKLKTQALRQQVSKASSEAHKESLEATAARDQALLMKKKLEAAQADTQKALTDLQVATNELKVAREMIAVQLPVDQGTNQTVMDLSALLQETKLHKQEAMIVCAEKEESREAKAAKRVGVCMCTGDLSAAQEGAHQTKPELQLARAEVKMGGAGVEVASENGHGPENEAMHAGEEAELAQKICCIASTENFTEREQSRHAREAAAVMRIGQFKTQVKTTEMGSEKAVAAVNCGKIRPQNGMQDNQEAKFSDLNTLYKMRKTHDKSEEFSESWEMVESGYNAGIAVTKVEYGTLKVKVSESEEFKASIKTELDSLIRTNERLSTDLDAAKLEIETLKFSEEEARQLHERAENENLILKTEVQRLARKGERLLIAWEKESEALKSNTHLGFCPSMSPERRLKGESLGQVLCMDLPKLHKEEEEEENAEVLPFPTKKKKKKALFLRIGTYLTKKKNQYTPHKF